MNKHNAWAIGVSLGAMMSAGPAIAQEGVGTPDIIVTAQKRNESLQQVNVAASVISGDSLAAQGIERLDDLQNAVPGLSITDAGLTQSVNIRGIGLASTSPNVSNGVALYFDGVFQPPVVSTNSMYDIGAVEVFRGPQGTFVGSNSTGGAIFISSKDPMLGSVGGFAQGEVGNYDRRGVQGAVNIPLGNALAVRIAGNYRKRDSFYKMTDPTVPAPAHLDEKGIRIGVKFEPSSQFRALLKAQIDRKNTGGYAYRPILGTRYSSFRTNDIYTLNYNTPGKNNEKADQFTAKLEYDTDGGTVFRSISGYQNKRVHNFHDIDGTNAATPLQPPTTQDQFVQERVWTQEVNIVSSDNQPLRWVAGGYFQRNKILVDIVNNPQAPVHTEIYGPSRKTTTGLFAQASYDLTDQFSVDVGTRYSTFKTFGTGAVQLKTPAGYTFLANPGGRESDDQVTGKVALNWKPNSNHLVYGFITKGYKSGGYASPITTFKPETVIDYEAGWKATLLAGALKTQFGAFYYDYKNFQLDALDGQTGRSSIINLTSAKVKGFEGQVQAALGGLNLSGSFSYTDSKLAGTQFVDARLVAFAYPGSNSVPNCNAGQSPSPTPPYNCINYSDFMGTTAGGPNLFSPKWTYGASISYEIRLPEISITPRLDYSHMGARYTYIAYDPVRDRLPSYDLLNSTISFEMDRFGFDLWATNLTKERYITGQSGGTNEFYGAPREYGLRVKVEF